MAIPSPTRAAGFGATSQSIAQQYQGRLPIVVFDVEGIRAALTQALQLKARGERFFARFIVQRPETLLLDAIAPQIFQTYTGRDERRVALDEAARGSLLVNGTPLRDARAYDGGTLRFASAIIRLSDGLAVSSESERRRICDVLGETITARTMHGADKTVPIPSDNASFTRNSIAIWAPSSSGTTALAVALPLLSRHSAIDIIASSGGPEVPGVRWVPVAESRNALSDAKVIVDTTWSGCETALALAEWRLPLVTDIESGAHEVLNGINTFDRRHPGSILAAVSSAIHPPRFHIAAASIGEPQVTEFRTDGPLVSLIIPTFNRPHKLREALESVERQRYTKIEAVVVNDGGDPLEEIIKDYPRARLLNMSENNPPKAFNAGYRATLGQYIGILCDDDVLFPDHVSVLVDVLESTGACAAHGDVITAFLHGSDGNWMVHGVDDLMHHVVDLDTLLVTNQLGTNSVLFRRDLLDTDGWLVDESVPYSRDYALWLRLAARVDFMRVERITSCYTIRNNGEDQVSVRWSDRTLKAFHAIYERFPVSNRPVIDRRRAARIQELSQGSNWFSAKPGLPVEATQWPLWRDDLAHIS